MIVAGGANDIRLSKFLASRVRDDRHLWRKAFHMLCFTAEKALGNQEWKVHVTVAGLLDSVIKLALHHLPDCIAIGLKDNTALHHLGDLGHIGLAHNVEVPLVIVLRPRCDHILRHGRS